MKKLKFFFRLLPHTFQGLSCLLPVQPYSVRLPPASLLPLIICWHPLHAASVISLWATILCSRLSKSFWLLIQILIWVSVPLKETDAIFYPDLQPFSPDVPGELPIAVFSNFNTENWIIFFFMKLWYRSNNNNNNNYHLIDSAWVKNPTSKFVSPLILNT